MSLQECLSKKQEFEDSDLYQEIKRHAELSEKIFTGKEFSEQTESSVVAGDLATDDILEEKLDALYESKHWSPSSPMSSIVFDVMSVQKSLVATPLSDRHTTWKHLRVLMSKTLKESPEFYQESPDQQVLQIQQFQRVESERMNSVNYRKNKLNYLRVGYEFFQCVICGKSKAT